MKYCEGLDCEICNEKEPCIYRRANKLQQCLDEIFENIEYIEATAERIDDDNYIVLACKIAETSRNILQLIKQAKEN